MLSFLACLLVVLILLIAVDVVILPAGAMPGDARQEAEPNSFKIEKRNPERDKAGKDNQGLSHGILREPSTISTQSGGLLDFVFWGMLQNRWFVKVFRSMTGFRSTF